MLAVPSIPLLTPADPPSRPPALQPGPPGLAQQAQLAQAQLAQLAQFLPRTNEPSPDEQDDADESEVRDTFMVRRAAPPRAPPRAFRPVNGWFTPGQPAQQRGHLAPCPTVEASCACGSAGVQARQAGLWRAAPGRRGGDRQPGGGGAARHHLQATGKPAPPAPARLLRVLASS